MSYGSGANGTRWGTSAASTRHVAQFTMRISQQTWRSLRFCMPYRPYAGAALRAAMPDGGRPSFSPLFPQLTRNRAESFYGEHNGKPFFKGLVDFMTSGPAVAMVLMRENAIKEWRALMGPTNTFVARETNAKW